LPGSTRTSRDPPPAEGWDEVAWYWPPRGGHWYSPIILAQLRHLLAPGARRWQSRRGGAGAPWQANWPAGWAARRARAPARTRWLRLIRPRGCLAGRGSRLGWAVPGPGVRRLAGSANTWPVTAKDNGGGNTGIGPPWLCSRGENPPPDLARGVRARVCVEGRSPPRPAGTIVRGNPQDLLGGHPERPVSQVACGEYGAPLPSSRQAASS
jgi:hypothetical protein